VACEFNKADGRVVIQWGGSGRVGGVCGFACPSHHQKRGGVDAPPPQPVARTWGNDQGRKRNGCRDVGEVINKAVRFAPQKADGLSLS